MSLIQGNIRDISRFNRVVSGLIELVNAPVSESPYLVSATSVTIQTDSNGFFEVTLGIGDYQLTIGTQKILFSVTQATGTFNIADLVTQDLVYTSKPYSSNWNGLRQGNIQFLFVADPAAPELSIRFTDAATELANAVEYVYGISYVTSQGETLISSPLVMIGDEVMNPDDGPYGHIVIPLEVNPANVVTKRIWRNKDGDNETDVYLLAEVAPGVAEYVDSESHAHFAARVDAEILPQTLNTTAGGIYADDVLIARVTQTGFQIVGGIPSNVSFDRSDTIQMSEYIGGIHQFLNASVLYYANIYCRKRPLTGQVTIALYVGGTIVPGVFFSLTPGAGDLLDGFDLASIPVVPLASISWRVVDGPSIGEPANPTDPADYPSGISISTNLKTNIL